MGFQIEKEFLSLVYDYQSARNSNIAYQSSLDSPNQVHII